MKYAHLADLHLGSWRDQKMRNLSNKAFLQAIDNCLNENVSFILFAGDLFNTSLPSVDTLKIVTEKLKELKDKNVPLYIIAGSHDFSPSGKTMIDVLEKAGLVINVCKGSIDQKTKELKLQFTIDQKTGAKITGIIGRRGLLDKTYYENLDRMSIEKEPGYKIFMFHTTVTELVPVHLTMIESSPASFFPKNFNYYAGGHIHHPTKINVPDVGLMTYTGALFPNNFSEVEKYGQGGYYIITVKENDNFQEQDVKWIPLKIINHIPLILDCNNKSPEEISNSIIESFSNKDLINTVITLKLKGTIKTGTVSDINFKEIFQKLYHQGAYFIMKNTIKLHSEEFEEIKISNTSPEMIEENVIKEHLQQIKIFDRDKELDLTKSLMNFLNTTKKEGETITDFKERVNSDLIKILEI